MKKHLRNLAILGLLVGLHVQAAPVFENAVTATGESSTVTLNKPIDTQTGDLLVAALMLDRGIRIEVAPPVGWTLIRRSNSHKYVGMATYYRVASQSEPVNYSFSLDEKTKWAASVSRISGADLKAPRDNSNRATGRKGNVVAASVTTRKDDTLVLAFYTNRRDATYTPDPSTTVRYDKPNRAGGLPSNMLATFEQAKAGSTGNKTAIPSRADRHWVGMQISIAPDEEAASDLSGFHITATGNPLAGDVVSLQITNAQDTEGTPLNGTVAAVVVSSLDDLVFDENIVFTDGSASPSITLTTVAAHTLTVAIASVTDPQALTVTVNRRPITLAADAGQSKIQNDPDPVLTFALTEGSLIAGIPLSGEPARDSGEDAGIYAIRQGPLTDAANPNYAITFVSEDFEIIPPVDLSGFSLITANAPVAGDALVLQITDAQATDGNPLNGAVAAAVISSLDGLIFDKDIVFTDGSATPSITLTTVAAHTLTVAIASVTNPQTLTVTVNRRPITLAADVGQNKMQNDPEPVLTFVLTDGSLLASIPLSGEPARDSGEDAGLYTIRQGSLTDAANPSYTITFASAAFEILSVEEPPPPPPPETGVWISANELATLPMSGAPWQMLKQDADTYWGLPNLSDQEDKANIYTMSKALVYARTGIESYRTEVIEACMQAVGTEEGGRSLALSRNLAAFVIAADLVGLPPEEDTLFCSWLRELLTQRMADGFSLTTCHEIRPNNWGTHAGASRAAVAAYLEDQDELDRIAQVFKGWLGDRNSYAGFSYGALYWQANSDRPVGINPVGATLQGYNVDGVLPDEQRLSGEFTWPPPKQGYVYESLQGALLQAVILHRAGYDVWNWENRALLRAWSWLHDAADYPATGDDTWQPFIINSFYDVDFPVPDVSLSGKNVARTCWTHSGLYSPPGTPPPVTNPPPSNSTLEYYPGDYSQKMVLGQSLPGTWRPFSADSPWNTPIPDHAATHPDSEQIMAFANSRISNVRLAGIFLTPIWVVNSENALPAGTVSDPTQPMNLHWIHMNSPSIFDTWDQNDNDISDVPIPLAKGMFSQGTEDGQFVIIDPFKNVAYEMSRFFGLNYDQETSSYPDYPNRGSIEPACSTFNVWDLSENGTGNPFEGTKWWTRGGKGSGFPLIAGVLRPEEVLSGEIRHALAFSFEENRRSDDGTDQIMMFPPACRSDGKHIGAKYPIEGMLFQLDPSLTEADFDRWGLTPEVKVLARALQKYGMYLDNIGGDMALATQQLGSTPAENRAAWDNLIPGFYHTVTKIPSDQFRIVYMGEPTIR